MPIAAPILFSISTLYCLAMFYWVARGSNLEKSKFTAIVISVVMLFWIMLQWTLTEFGIYSENMDSLPPKIVLYGVLPLIVILIYSFNSKKGKVFIDSLPLNRVTAVHIVRILVEIGLFYVYLGKKIPEIMTFSGQNYDIIAGLTAPFIIYFGFIKRRLSRQFLLGWNIICLGLLFYIILLAFLASPSPLQQISFNQPNVAIFLNPFSLLPTVIVPFVIFMHLVAIRQLIYKHYH